MKLFSFLQNKDARDDEVLLEDDPTPESDDTEETEEDEGVTLGTKIKVITALLVIGFSTYIAYWIQEPTQIKVDILDSQGSIAEEDTVAAADEAAQQISIIDFAFAPAGLTFEDGETVVWTNMDSVEHTVTGDTFTSGPLSSGESYTYTFGEEGTYEYFCSFHPQMKGTITIASSIVDLANQPAEVAEPAPEAPELAPAAGDSLGDVTSLDSFMAETEVIPEQATVTFDAQDFLAANDLEEAAAAEQAVDITETEKLAETGPENFLYVGLLLIILYFNRRKLLGAYEAKRSA